VLYRVFPLVPGALADGPGTPLYVARHHQGEGRHDNPERYGALYASRSPESAVAERLQQFRGQELTDRDLVRTDGARVALAAIDDAGLSPLLDLDDPSTLAPRGLRPSAVATHERPRTQRMALAIHDEGVVGFSWWSVLEASWTNVTLFAERAVPALEPAGEPEPLTTEHPAVIAAAEALAVALVSPRRAASGRTGRPSGRG
jgi:RES domain